MGGVDGFRKHGDKLARTRQGPDRPVDGDAELQRRRAVILDLLEEIRRDVSAIVDPARLDYIEGYIATIREITTLGNEQAVNYFLKLGSLEQANRLDAIFSSSNLLRSLDEIIAASEDLTLYGLTLARDHSAKKNVGAFLAHIWVTCPNEFRDRSGGQSFCRTSYLRHFAAALPDGANKGFILLLVEELEKLDSK